MATAKPPFRDRFERFIGELREREHRQMAWNFTKSILLLTIAMLAALYANSTARDGRVIPSAIAALISLSIAVWVSLRFVPRMAAGVDWDWLPFFTQYRLTRDGWIYIAATTVVMSAAINTSNNLLYMVLAALLAVMVLSGFLSGLELPVPASRGEAPRSLLRPAGVSGCPNGKESQAALPDFLAPGEPGR